MTHQTWSASWLRKDILLVLATCIFVFGSIYISKQYFSRSWFTAAVQDIALTHCDTLYTEYAKFQQAVKSDPECEITWEGTAAKQEWLELSEQDWDDLSTAFDTDGSLVIYDEQLEDRIQEWRIMIAVTPEDEWEAAELAKDSISYLNKEFGAEITDIKFLFPRTKLYYDYIIEYKTKIWVDIAAFATHLDENKKYEWADGKKLVLVNPNVILWHNDDDIPQPTNFGTQSYDDGPLDQRYLSYIGHDTAMECLPEGKPIKVAVVDNGFDLKHPDIAPSIFKWYDEANKDDDAHIPKIEKAWNHGTKEAGIIWAQHNDFGIKGIHPNAELIVVKSTKDTANGRDITNGIEAIATAYDMWAEVINLSRWWYGKVPMLERITKKIASKWGILVAAAGNYNKSEPFYPAAYDWVTAVAAIDQEWEKASFSNFGPWVDVAAPWVDMLTTDLDNTYNKYNGTSEASPVVAGTIALALSHGLLPTDVFENLKSVERGDIWAWQIDLEWMCDAITTQSDDSSDEDASEDTKEDKEDEEHTSADSDTAWIWWFFAGKEFGIWLLLLVLWLGFWIFDIIRHRKKKVKLKKVIA